MTISTKLPVDTTASAEEMANAMFGEGITVISATYTGDDASSGIYTDGNTVAPDVVPADSGVILSTGAAADFTNEGGSDQNNLATNTSTNTSGIDGEADLSALVGRPVYDAAVFEAEFIPEGDTVTMQLVFGSEEYLEWVNSGYNDVVGIWVNGELAEMTIGDGAISIDNINDTSNENLFIDNTDGALNTEMDGVTVVVTVKATVQPGEVNTIKIAIADDGDAIYDSNLLIVGDSIQSAVIAEDDSVTVASKNAQTIDLTANDDAPEGARISKINGVDVIAGDVVALESGETVRLNEDGTVTVTAAPNAQNSTISYTLESPEGTTDVAFLTITTSPVDGTAGNDHMVGGYTDADGQIIDGADGVDDVIYGHGGNDKIFAGEGDDDIYGGDGDDFIRGEDGADVIEGGAGNDVIDGGQGDDVMAGGDGDDSYYIHDAGDVLTGETGGHDTVHSALDHTLDIAFEDLWLMDDSAAIRGTGNASSNFIHGNGNDNFLLGLDGDDELLGYDGNDVIEGGNGADKIDGGAGADTLDGGAGDDKLTGGEGADQLDGGAGQDTLCGGDGDDILLGGDGADILGGGTGADHMEGGAGDDEYIVENAGDVVIEAADGGTDRVRSSVDIVLSDNVEDLLMEGDAISGTGNAANNSIWGNDADNILSGGDGADRLVGGMGDDLVDGGAGNDSLDGGADNDILTAGSGHDKLKGGSGNDRLEGGSGNDRLAGGSGEDVFVFNAGDGNDVLYDFEIGTDSLQFSGLSEEDIWVEDYGKGIKLHYGESDIYMLGVSAEDYAEFDIGFEDALVA
ncbi:choice-of-anchor L domain-containing protein [Aliiruegeria lutimaris]|uniref:Ca2+-binding protein, RTX toxin-related n=1 Tax=Aliiruegeria lutimaris TaxID=571298 RepID=A0A1G8WKP0_9RHOB|nr:choice-of-anchor L domain-containing protein [Aliiruegeria lutimaris]SDJ78899.1 Ca2+-binding protein, RTX toxin-related [Aliiruegeria lutimaris]